MNDDADTDTNTNTDVSGGTLDNIRDLDGDNDVTHITSETVSSFQGGRQMEGASGLSEIEQRANEGRLVFPSVFNLS